jgi:hypothetical protein
MRARFQNAVFGIVILFVILVTAWSLVAREPELARVQGGAVERAEEKLASPANVPSAASAEKNLSTRQMIERGLLSKEPARYWHTEAP